MVNYAPFRGRVGQKIMAFPALHEKRERNVTVWEVRASCNGSEKRGYCPFRLMRTDSAWALRPSAPAIVSIMSPIASRPSLSMIWTVDDLQKCETFSPEYILA